MAIARVTATIAAENTYSDPVRIQGKFNVSLSGTWVATVHVQRSFDLGETWVDVGSYSSPTELIGEEAEGNVRYRFGVKTGNYVSGSVSGRIGQ